MNVNFRDVRTQILMVAGALLLLALAAVILLLSPMGRSRTALQHKYEELRQQKVEKMQTAGSVEGMDKKIATAREQQVQFKEERLAEHYSTMSDQLANLASEAGVGVSKVQYDQRDQKDQQKDSVPGFDSVGITIQIHGSYEQTIRFINAVERQKMMLLIDSVSFSGLKDNQLTVSIHLSTFLRSAA